MLIPIESRDGKAQEWVLVELQGRVESLTSEEVSQIGVLLAGQVRVQNCDRGIGKLLCEGTGDRMYGEGG